VTVTLHLGDCLEYMRGMADKSVDAVVTDPPYGIGITKSPRISVSRGFGGLSWDDNPADEKQISKILTLSDKVIIWGGNYFDLPPTRCFLIWDKNNSGRDFADCEMAWTNFDAVARIYKQRPQNMDGGKVHPTQKPLGLMTWVIRNYTAEGDTVFDPFMGSGTTGVAAVQLGRNFIGCEINPDYFAIAEKRIKQAQEARQLELV
jgi:site-specific DNA-methyltransferase (adenine-specific)